jgi:hypothetical protein
LKLDQDKVAAALKLVAVGLSPTTEAPTANGACRRCNGKSRDALGQPRSGSFVLQVIAASSWRPSEADRQRSSTGRSWQSAVQSGVTYGRLKERLAGRRGVEADAD